MKKGVCLFVLKFYEPNGVMLIAVSLPNLTYWAGLVLQAVNQYCTHSTEM